MWSICWLMVLIASLLLLALEGTPSYERGDEQSDAWADPTDIYTRVYNAVDGVTLCEAKLIDEDDLGLDPSSSEITSLPCDINTSTYNLALGENRIMVDVYLGSSGETISTFQVAAIVNSDQSYLDGYDVDSYAKKDHLTYTKHVLRAATVSCTLSALIQASGRPHWQHLPFFWNNTSFGHINYSSYFGPDSSTGGKKHFTVFGLFGIVQRRISSLTNRLRSSSQQSAVLVHNETDNDDTLKTEVTNAVEALTRNTSILSSHMDVNAAKGILRSRVGNLALATAALAPSPIATSSKTIDNNVEGRSLTSMMRRLFRSLRMPRRSLKTIASVIVLASAAVKFGPGAIDQLRELASGSMQYLTSAFHRQEAQRDEISSNRATKTDREEDHDFFSVSKWFFRGSGGSPTSGRQTPANKEKRNGVRGEKGERRVDGGISSKQRSRRDEFKPPASGSNSNSNKNSAAVNYFKGLFTAAAGRRRSLADRSSSNKHSAASPSSSSTHNRDDDHKPHSPYESRAVHRRKRPPPPSSPPPAAAAAEAAVNSRRGAGGTTKAEAKEEEVEWVSPFLEPDNLPWRNKKYLLAEYQQSGRSAPEAAAVIKGSSSGGYISGGEAPGNGNRAEEEMLKRSTRRHMRYSSDSSLEEEGVDSNHHKPSDHHHSSSSSKDGPPRTTGTTTTSNRWWKWWNDVDINNAAGGTGPGIKTISSSSSTSSSSASIALVNDEGKEWKSPYQYPSELPWQKQEPQHHQQNSKINDKNDDDDDGHSNNILAKVPTTTVSSTSLSSSRSSPSSTKIKSSSPVYVRRQQNNDNNAKVIKVGRISRHQQQDEGTDERTRNHPWSFSTNIDGGASSTVSSSRKTVRGLGDRRRAKDEEPYLPLQRQHLSTTAKPTTSTSTTSKSGTSSIRGGWASSRIIDVLRWMLKDFTPPPPPSSSSSSQEDEESSTSSSGIGRCPMRDIIEAHDKEIRSSSLR